MLTELLKSFLALILMLFEGKTYVFRAQIGTSFFYCFAIKSQK
jgi:hypothetical protein